MARPIWSGVITFGLVTRIPEDLPIYQGLIQEHGDVLADSRSAAKVEQERVAEALNWNDVHLAGEDTSA